MLHIVTGNKGHRSIIASAILIGLRLRPPQDWNIVRRRIAQIRDGLDHEPDKVPALAAQMMLVSGEDHRHSRHAGYDLIAICRAVWRNLTEGSHQGASTIEQQLVRTITGKYERTILRKVREILLAMLVADNFDKRLTPQVYLTIAYFGWRMNGYQQACQQLSLDPIGVTPAEAADLVARLKYPHPSTLSFNRAAQIRLRRKHLLGLYQIHSQQNTYEHINGSALRYKQLNSKLETTFPEIARPQARAGKRNAPKSRDNLATLA